MNEDDCDRHTPRVISAPEAMRYLSDALESPAESSMESSAGLRGESRASLTRTCGPTQRPHTRLFDARDLAPSYYWRHANGAMHTPWRHFTRARRSGVLLDAGELAHRLRALGICPRDHIIIYGDWERGWGEEARMLWLLEYAGHERVSLIEGGWRAWLAAGGETTRGLNPSVSPSDWSPRWRAEVRVETREIPSLLASGVRSLDARSRREYHGETPYGSPVGGHLRHSVHLPWRSLLDEQMRLKSPKALRAQFEAFGAQVDEPIFTYCTGGIRSAFIYLALREAGFNHAMNYDGSWWDWSQTLGSHD